MIFPAWVSIFRKIWGWTAEDERELQAFELVHFLSRYFSICLEPVRDIDSFCFEKECNRYDARAKNLLFPYSRVRVY